MGRKLFIVLMLSLGLVTLVACTRAQEPTATPPPTPTPARAQATPIPTPTAVPTPTPDLRPTQWTVVYAAGDTALADPFTEYGSSFKQSAGMVLEPLIGDFGSDKRTTGILAESWEFPTPTTFLVHLKQGVKFHDGGEFEADDVIFNYEGHKNSKPPTRIWNGVLFPLGVAEKVDKYTVRWTMSRQDSTLLDNFQQFTPVSSKAYKAMGPEKFAENPVGTGPYRSVQWKRGEPVIWEVHSSHHKWDVSKIVPKRVTIRYIKDPATRSAEALAGRADIVEQIESEDAVRVQRDPGLGIGVAADSAYGYIINTYVTNPPLYDVRVRRALNYAIDRFTITETMYGQWGFPAASVIGGPGQEGYIEGLKPYPYDPAKARQLLADAGWTQGFSINFTATRGHYPKDIEVAEAMQQYLAEVGIKFNIVVTERAKLLAQRSSSEFEILSIGGGGTTNRSEMFGIWFLTAVSHQLQGPEAEAKRKEVEAKWGRQADPYVVRMVEFMNKTKGSWDPAEKHKFMQEVNMAAHDGAVRIFVAYTSALTAVRRDIRWYPFFHYGSHIWFNLHELTGTPLPKLR